MQNDKNVKNNLLGFYNLPIIRNVGRRNTANASNPLLKEWAFAGFFFAMSGATISHFAVGQAITEALPSIILLLVTVTSWYFRPNDRKVIELQKQN